ncbi:AAA-like domain-containing protein [Nostoc sp. FACHB-280]|nr:AAA-like domain-containing protein [Nostoc sp. FACHB-280]
MLLLAEKYNFDGDVQQIKPLIDGVSGHPYLLGEAFAHL